MYLQTFFGGFSTESSREFKISNNRITKTAETRDLEPWGQISPVINRQMAKVPKKKENIPRKIPLNAITYESVPSKKYEIIIEPIPSTAVTHPIKNTGRLPSFSIAVKGLNNYQKFKV